MIGIFREPLEGLNMPDEGQKIEDQVLEFSSIGSRSRCITMGNTANELFEARCRHKENSPQGIETQENRKP